MPGPASGDPIVLLYHGTPRKTRPGRVDESSFAQQIRFLKQHCELIGPESLRFAPRNGRPRVLLTFDDGFQNNYRVARPILQEHGIPATFFITSRHGTPGKYLWFAYLRALEDWYPETTITFRGERFPMAQDERRSSMQRLMNLLLSLKSHPLAMYQAIESELPRLDNFVPPEALEDLCSGMSAEQVSDLASDPLFTIGGHTVDHPFLTRCTRDGMLQQIQENKRWIEEECGVPVQEFAYPSGDYDGEVLNACARIGFARAYAVIPSKRTPGPLEVGRIGIYGTSLDALGFIVKWGNTLRAMRIPLG